MWETVKASNLTKLFVGAEGGWGWGIREEASVSKLSQMEKMGRSSLSCSEN